MFDIIHQNIFLVAMYLPRTWPQFGQWWVVSRKEGMQQGTQTQSSGKHKQKKLVTNAQAAMAPLPAHAAAPTLETVLVVTSSWQ